MTPEQRQNFERLLRACVSKVDDYLTQIPDASPGSADGAVLLALAVVDLADATREQTAALSAIGRQSEIVEFEPEPAERRALPYAVCRTAGPSPLPPRGGIYYSVSMPDGVNAYVKPWQLFVGDGGLVEEWGKRWVKTWAADEDEAAKTDFFEVIDREKELEGIGVNWVDALGGLAEQRRQPDLATVDIETRPRRWAVCSYPSGVDIVMWEIFVHEGGLVKPWGLRWRSIQRATAEEARRDASQADPIDRDLELLRLSEERKHS